MNPDSLPTLEQRRDARIAERRRKNRERERQIVRNRKEYKKQRHARIVFLTTLPDALLDETYEFALARYRETRGKGVL